MKKTKEECLLMNGIIGFDLGKNEARIFKAMDDWATDVVKHTPNNKSEVLSDFIAEVKKEFPDQNWDYMDFIKDRVLNK